MGTRNTIAGIIKCFGKNWFTSADLAGKFGYSLQLSSAHLSRCWKYNYLIRKRNPLKRKQFMYRVSKHGLKYYTMVMRENYTIRRYKNLLESKILSEYAKNLRSPYEALEIIEMFRRKRRIEKVDSKWL